MLYTIPLAGKTALLNENDLRRIELFLSDRGVAVGGLVKRAGDLLIEASADPAPALETYTSTPTLEDRALQAGRTAIQAIRSRPMNQWTDAERLAVSIWALLVREE